MGVKTIVSYVVVLSWLALVGQSCGPDNSRKMHHDATYSTHNYKHPNKVDSARKWDANPGVAVQSPIVPAHRPGESNLTDYKRQVPNQAPVGGITVNYTSPADVANRNYKMQRSSQFTGLLGSGVAGKARKNPAKNGTALGD